MSKYDLFRAPSEGNGAGSPVGVARALTRRQCMLLSLAGATDLVLQGCGGGGGKASGGTGGVTGTLISGDQRAAAITGVSTFFSQLSHTSVQDDNQKLVAYLSGNSSFVAAGSQSAGSVWARFKDGTPLIIVNDGSVTTADAGAMAIRSLASAPPSRATRGATELPTGQNIYLVNCIGLFATFILPLQALQNAYMYNIAQTAINALATDLKNIGYKNVQNIEGTPVNLKGVHNADLLYLFAHLGYTIVPGGSQVIGIGTSVPVLSATGFDQVNFGLLQSDIMAGNVGFMMYVDIDATAGTKVPILKSYYFITPSFITKYMTFTNQSFVFLNGCESNADATEPLANAFKSAGATVYAGWDNLVNGTEVSTSGQILLEEMAGQNSVVQITPPQRPFPYPSVLAHMQSLMRPGKTSGGQSYNYAQTNGLNGIANLQITPLTTASNQFGLLAPSIQSLFVDDNNGQLQILGDFGAVAGTVMMGNVPLKLAKPWSASTLICTLPPTGGGDVIVTVNGHNSNARRLTQWLLPVHYKGSGTGSGDGHTETADFTLCLRADASSYRVSAGAAPVTTNLSLVSFETAAGSTGKYTYQGQFMGRDATNTLNVVNWSGSGGLAPAVGTSSTLPPSFTYNGHFDFNAGLVYLQISAKTVTGVVLTQPENSNFTPASLGWFIQSTSSFGVPFVKLSINSQFVIQGNTITGSFPGDGLSILPNMSTSLKWDTTSPTAGTAPDPQMPR